MLFLGATLAPNLSAQALKPLGGVLVGDFSITDSPCAYKRNPSVEKAVAVLRLTVVPSKPSKTGSDSFFELRNISQKTITAYVFSYAAVRRGRKTYYQGIGEDFLYRMALARLDNAQAPPNSTLPPGGIHRRQLWSDRSADSFEVYPCAIVFDDGTAIGPPSVLAIIAQMRSQEAKFMAMLISGLELALNSDDPRATLINRAKQMKEKNEVSSAMQGDYLEDVARLLLTSHDSAHDKTVVAGYILTLRAQQKMLSEHPTFR
jgi:hypothetical protein